MFDQFDQRKSRIIDFMAHKMLKIIIPFIFQLNSNINASLMHEKFSGAHHNTVNTLIQLHN